MVSVPASQVYREWGRYSDVAQREAVSITSHGRESLVLLSAEEYHRLKALDTRQAFPAVELTDAERHALETVRAPDKARAFDHEMDS